MPVSVGAGSSVEIVKDARMERCDGRGSETLGLDFEKLNERHVCIRKEEEISKLKFVASRWGSEGQRELTFTYCLSAARTRLNTPLMILSLTINRTYVHPYLVITSFSLILTNTVLSGSKPASYPRCLVSLLCTWYCIPSC